MGQAQADSRVCGRSRGLSQGGGRCPHALPQTAPQGEHPRSRSCDRRGANRSRPRQRGCRWHNPRWRQDNGYETHSPRERKRRAARHPHSPRERQRARTDTPGCRRTPQVSRKRERPRSDPDVPIADRRQDSEANRKTLRIQDIDPGIARRGEDPDSSLGRMRWVVERTSDSFTGSRRIRARYDRRARSKHA